MRILEKNVIQRSARLTGSAEKVTMSKFTMNCSFMKIP